MKGLRSICLCLLTLTGAVPALAQLELPDALQGNPLGENVLAETSAATDWYQPIHFFSFDGSIVDEVTGVTGTPSGGVTHADGYLGGAIYFDGTGIVQLPVDISPKSVPNLTIVAMIKPAPLPDDPEENPSNIGYIVSDKDGLIVISNQTKPEPRFEAYSTGAAISSSTNTGIRDGWQMVAITRAVEERTTDDGELKPHTVLKLFTNGRVSEDVRVQKTPSIAPTLLLGMKSAGHSYSFSGAIDHLSIYQRALSADELNDLMARMRQARVSRRSDVMVAGSGASVQDGESNSVTMTDDQRSAAAPAAGTAAIGASSPSFTRPVDTADQTQELIASEEGQEMLQSADWRIEGMVPNTLDKSTLYPGDEVTLKIRISKDDAANKIPSVRLVTNVGPGIPSPSYELTINTAEAKPTDERDVPVTLTVPETLAFEDGATQTVWRPKVWLNAPDGLPLRDAITDNHSRELQIVVFNAASIDGCGLVQVNPDGTRSVGSCLEAPYVYTDEDLARVAAVRVDLSAAHETALSGYGSLEAADRLVLDTRHLLGFIKISERADRPCRIAIDDSLVRAGDPGQVVHRCNKRSARDHREFRVSGGWAITGLRVCHSRFNADRVKSVEVNIRPVGSDGELGRQRTEQTQPAGNCGARWRGWVRCPNHKVAGGITASFATRPGNDELRGVGLICGDIVVENAQ